MKHITPIFATHEDSLPLKSELLLLLENLQDMMKSYFHGATHHARFFTLQAIDIEARLLSCKLKHMHERWARYLPFHESIDVNFAAWAHEIQSWVDAMGTGERQLGMGFLLDLMGEEVHTPGKDLEHDVPAYCSKIDKQLLKSPKGWEESFYGCSHEPAATDGELKDELAPALGKAARV